MSSEQDKMYTSSDNEGRKRPVGYSGGEEKGGRAGDDVSDGGSGMMRYYPGGVPPAMPGRVPLHGSPRASMSEDSDLTDAMVFLNRIKEEYADSLPVYDSFLETMRDFKFGKIDADEVCKAVRILFKEKPFLVRQFDEYLPNHLRYGDRAYVSGSEREKYGGYRMAGYPGPHPMGRMVPGGPMHMGRGGMPMHAPPYAGRPVPLASPPHSPPGKAMRLNGYEAESSKHRMANDFIQLVKKRYASRPIVYKQFIELLQNSKHGFDKLLSHVSALLIDTPELIEKFERNFRPAGNSEPSGGAESDPLRGIKDVLAEKGVLEEFLRLINFYNQNFIGAEDLVFMLGSVIEDQEAMKAFKAFIKYEEGTGGYDARKFRDYEKAGSYKIFPSPLVLGSTSALAREVLNNMCVSVSVLESEDGYVFRNKNNSEELLARVNDERSEGDLHLDRLKYLITKLEELYTHMDDARLDMDNIEMSAAPIKETLRKVYEAKSSEVLETILANPRKAIPVVLNRLHRVYKENLALHRKQKKLWRGIVNENYYRAYDTKGVLFKIDERALSSLKHVHSAASTPFSVKIESNDLLPFIRQLFVTMVNAATNSAYRKATTAQQIALFDSIIAQFSGADFIVTVSFDHYALYLYILTVYTRFAEVHALSLPPLSQSSVAVSIGLQPPFSVPDRSAQLRSVALQLMAKEIDPDTFEEQVRQLTDSKGYKLYNLRKIFSRIEKQVNAVIEQQAAEHPEPSFPGQYLISLKDSIVSICQANEPSPAEE